MTEREIAALADEVLRPLLATYGYDHAGARVGLDHDGDAAVYVEAFYHDDSRRPNGTALLEAHGALAARLEQAGERRLPYLEHRFPRPAPGQEGVEEAEDDEPNGLAP